MYHLAVHELAELSLDRAGGGWGGGDGSGRGSLS